MEFCLAPLRALPVSATLDLVGQTGLLNKDKFGTVQQFANFNLILFLHRFKEFLKSYLTLFRY